MNGLLIGTIISSGIGVISSFLLTKEDNNESSNNFQDSENDEADENDGDFGYSD